MPSTVLYFAYGSNLCSARLSTRVPTARFMAVGYVAGRRLPFTPGLIPSQRHTIARNIATTFEQQLLSSREIHAYLTGDEVRRKVAAKVDQILVGLGPLAAMAQGFKPVIVEKIVQSIDEMAEEAVAEGSDLDVATRIQERIDEMEIARLEELILGFSRTQFRHITFFGGVLGLLIGLVQALLSHALGPGL